MYQGKTYIFNTFIDTFSIISNEIFDTINERNKNFLGMTYINNIEYVKFLK